MLSPSPREFQQAFAHIRFKFMISLGARYKKHRNENLDCRNNHLGREKSEHGGMERRLGHSDKEEDEGRSGRGRIRSREVFGK